MKSQFTKQRARKFLSYYKPHRNIFLMDMFFAALSACSVLLFPLVSGYLTGEVLAQWDSTTKSKLIGAAFFLVVLTVVKVISNITYAYFGHSMGAKMEETMRTELFCHYESLSFDFHARNSTGKLMTVLSNDLTNMTELFHHAPEDLLMTLIKFVGAFVIMLSIHVSLTLIVFLTLPFLGIAAYYTDKRMERCLLQNKRHLSELNEYAEDTLSGIRTVKAFGKEAEHAKQFRQQNARYTESKCIFYKLEAYFYETVEAYPQFLSMMVVIFGSLFIARGSLNAAVLVTFLLYAESLAEPIRTMLNFMRLFEEGKASFIRFMDMMEIQTAVQQAKNAVPLPNPTGEIVFDKVSFHYEDSPDNVLEDVSFRIQSGQTVAFAGASGIGKTTVASLIARFYDVCAGQIRIDGVDIRDLLLSDLQKHIGIVQQEVYIFNGTIRENIRYGRKDATDEEIVEAAKLANIHEFILSLEHGYNSIVGTRGIMLSGGQRQRISIAHRLSTIRNADRIYVLSDRGISEQGTHDELIARNGEYAKLSRIGTL